MRCGAGSTSSAPAPASPATSIHQHHLERFRHSRIASALNCDCDLLALIKLLLLLLLLLARSLGCPEPGIIQPARTQSKEQTARPNCSGDPPARKKPWGAARCICICIRRPPSSNPCPIQPSRIRTVVQPRPPSTIHQPYISPQAERLRGRRLAADERDSCTVQPRRHQPRSPYGCVPALPCALLVHTATPHPAYHIPHTRHRDDTLAPPRVPSYLSIYTLPPRPIPSSSCSRMLSCSHRLVPSPFRTFQQGSHSRISQPSSPGTQATSP